MFTEAQLVSFGNFLLKTYGVQVFSNDGQNAPLYQREVTDADFCNWKEEEKPDELQLPSRFQQTDKVFFFPRTSEDQKDHEIPGLPAEILAVHFYTGKVKYDLSLTVEEKEYSRIYNVDSLLVGPRK